jgi:hypothetical protein
MRRSPILLLLAALGGCAGYAADHWRPEATVVGPQVVRFASEPAQAQCVTERLTSALSVRQLRRLADTAAAVTAPEGRTLTLPDLVAVSAHVRGGPVQPVVAAAAAACAGNTGSAATAPAPATSAGETSATAPATDTTPAPAPASAPHLWVNLGSAVSGQAIAVQVASVEQEGNVRTAWFRLTNPGQNAVGAPAYRLRIDCSARTINSMALRQYDASGAVAAERAHGPQGEGALPVEGGTVMELAFLALCT